MLKWEREQGRSAEENSGFLLIMINILSPLHNNYRVSSSSNKLWLKIKGSIVHFTTIGSNVAIWLANLLLSIRVKTTLHPSTCHAMVTHGKNCFIWPWHCGKKKLTVSRLCLVNPKHFDRLNRWWHGSWPNMS